MPVMVKVADFVFSPPMHIIRSCRTDEKQLNFK